ncbi:ParA family protein [Rubripirellula reticaptiva]|uniref:MinD/ParA/CobQ/CobA-like protein n=1 Tax=Rubripirellula reticaptiva TaxID=2528013 RepID=A0A5C6EP84_9BACT|nr:ParA family protein [Rubripirellula reticaptiva]TWU49426.1 MinD/ParA/CobQ/CobA-like protein [Rubripirellula reticaptiva]
MIIGLANSKGGVGKSTLARNLVVYLNDLGFSTALVDAEEYAPTATLLKNFDSNLILRSATSLDGIDDEVQELSESGHHVIIDAPGKEGDQVSTLCLLSDLVLIPLCVSEQDLLQTVGVINLVRRQQRRSEGGKPDASIVLTRTLKNDIAVPSVRENLLRYGIPVADTEIRERIAIKRNTSVMRDKRFGGKDGPATDVQSLVAEIILPRLNNEQRVSNE